MLKIFRLSDLFLSFLLFSLFITGCKKDDTPEPEVIVPDASVVNKFVYNNLKDYYLWEDKISQFTGSKYSDTDTLNAFLNGYSDHEKLFESLLYNYGTVDKWSFIVDDSKVIDDWIQGISETMGYDFMLGYIGSSNDLFGFVRYVYKDSPAEKAGIKRGDVFLEVNGQQLTVSNYQSLLFNNTTYTLSMASISDNAISLNNQKVTMTAIKMQENPILLSTVLTNNNEKIGYLVYNAFNADFDLALNDVFGDFKSQGIQKLILDLRYNGGGSIQSAVYLASMIYGTDDSKVFIKSEYNALIQSEIVKAYGADYLNEYFTDKIEKTSTAAEATINTLNLKQLYVITSDNTASASELLINGLKPYMDVVNVGINTTGKYVGSITIKDEDDNGTVNPNNTWAMQPIVVKIANSQGVSDYVDGLVPDISAEEDFANLIGFGDPSETLLNAVLNDINGLSQTGVVLKSKRLGMKKVFDLQDYGRFAKQMYINAPFKFK